MNFTDFFNANSCTQKIKAIITDRQLVEAGANPYAEVWANIENNDSEIYLFLTEQGAAKYEKMDGEAKSIVEALLHDWIKENFNYRPGANYVTELYGEFQLQIWHKDTPDTELTLSEAERAADEWCADNDHYHEGLFWQQDDSDVWSVGICPNNYQG